MLQILCIRIEALKYKDTFYNDLQLKLYDDMIINDLVLELSLLEDKKHPQVKEYDAMFLYTHKAIVNIFTLQQKQVQVL